MAFLDVEAAGAALCRRWLVTAEQFADVVAQENRADPGTVTVDWDGLAAQGSAVVGEGWYGRLVWCGEVAAAPVVTFTAARHAEPSAPSARTSGSWPPACGPRTASIRQPWPTTCWPRRAWPRRGAGLL